METQPTNDAWFDRRGLWLLAALAFLPLVWCWSGLRQLFWFGDEWDQLDQISRLGFGRWIGGFFGENFAPVFKAVWGALVLGGGGRYLVVVLGVWLSHAIAVVLFGRWLRAAGFSIFETAFAAVGFGLAASNFETLTWTIQLLTVLTMLFFFAAGRRQLVGDALPWTTRSLAALATLVTLSTFSSARGVLTGLSLAGGALMLRRSPHPARWPVTAACLVPALVSFVLMTLLVTGGAPRFSSDLGPPLVFATWHFALNPLHRLFDAAPFGPHTTVLFGLVKLAVLASGWKLSDPARRRVLLPLLLLDVGTSLLLGLGRHHTGLETVTSSRYQYVELACFLPFAAVGLRAGLDRFARWPVAQRTAAVVAVGALAAIALEPWPRFTRFVAESNGRAPRQALLVDPHPPAQGTVPGIDFISTARAKELIAEFQLR